MHEISQATRVSVGRAVGFGVLAIVMTMLGTCFDPLLTLKCGAFGFTLMAAILLFKAERAPARDHRATEVWMMIPKDRRPPEAVARPVITRAAVETYGRFGLHAALAAQVLWVVEIAYAVLKIA